MWTWLIWVSLAVAIAATIAGGAKAVVDTLRFFRDFKRSRRRVFKELDSVAAAAERAGLRAEAAGGGSERLTSSLDRLAASRRRLAVLQQAFDEATDAFRWVGFVYPRK